MTPGFFCCLCPDYALLKDAIQQTIAETGLSQNHTCHLFRGDEELPQAFWKTLTLQGFDPTVRVITLRHAECIPASDLHRLSSTLGRPNPQAFCILCLESPWVRGKPKLPAHVDSLKCITFAHTHGWWKEIPPLTETTLIPFLQRKASELGLSFAPGAVAAIARALPADASAITSELSKLSLLAGSRTQHGKPTLLAEDAALINQEAVFDIFGMLNRIQSGHTAQVWKDLQAESPDEILFPLLGLLRTATRESWQLLAGETPPMNPRSLRSRQEFGQRLGFSGLTQLIDAVHSADLAVKTGRQDPAQALGSLVARLSQIMPPARI